VIRGKYIENWLTGKRNEYLLTPIDRATLLHAKSTILLCPLSTITKKRASVESKLLHRPINVGY